MKQAVRISILMCGLVGTYVVSRRSAGSRPGRRPDSSVPTSTTTARQMRCSYRR